LGWLKTRVCGRENRGRAAFAILESVFLIKAGVKEAVFDRYGALRFVLCRYKQL